MQRHNEQLERNLIMQVTVIGAANVDIITKSKGKIVHSDSNPASVRLAAGGVARNIAENLLKLGAKVELITAVGADSLGGFLRRNCERLGISTKAWIVREDMSTGVYSAALDADGELYVGFNATGVLESVKPDDLAPYGDVIRKADLLIVEANLTEETLGAIIQLRGDAPVMADTVSVPKAPRITPYLPGISILKLNRAEAERLTGLKLDDSVKYKLACKELISRGVKRVFITRGPAGVCAADEDGAIFIPAVPVAVKNVTGAGDAFAAGVAMHFREDLKTQAEYGAELAARYLRRTV
jgi:pseudouridine kinase